MTFSKPYDAGLLIDFAVAAVGGNVSETGALRKALSGAKFASPRGEFRYNKNPGAIYAAASHAAPSPSALPPTIGLVQQASNLGQFAGPLVLGVRVEHFGWHAVPFILAPAALVGRAAALVLRHILVIGKAAGTTRRRMEEICGSKIGNRLAARTLAKGLHSNKE